jgi:putative transposase
VIITAGNQPGRPVILREVRDLIRKMCRENPGWGAPRIHGELLKLGIDIGESSVSKYMLRCRRPPSHSWRTFLENHGQRRTFCSDVKASAALQR